MTPLDRQRQKVSEAVSESFRLGYMHARRTALNAAHELVLAEIRACGLFQGKAKAAERVYDAVRHALDREFP